MQNKVSPVPRIVSWMGHIQYFRNTSLGLVLKISALPKKILLKIQSDKLKLKIRRDTYPLDENMKSALTDIFQDNYGWSFFNPG